MLVELEENFELKNEFFFFSALFSKAVSITQKKDCHVKGWWPSISPKILRSHHQCDFQDLQSFDALTVSFKLRIILRIIINIHNHLVLCPYPEKIWLKK